MRFARFAQRALTAARDRGMTDDQIEAATGIGASTFHRWQRGSFKRAPELSRVRKFCAGLGIPASEALAALGISEDPHGRTSLAPEPPLDPDVKIILRALADPSTPEDQKRTIRSLLQMLARQSADSSRGRIRRGPDSDAEAV